MYLLFKINLKNIKKEKYNIQINNLKKKIRLHTTIKIPHRTRKHRHTCTVM